MLEKIYEELLVPARSGHIPENACQLIDEFQNSEAYSAAWDSFCNERISAAATSSLYEGLRIANIGEHKGWNAVLIQPSSLTAMATLADSSRAITTPPTFNLVYVVSAPPNVKLRRYRIENFPKPGDLHGKMVPVLCNEEDITTGDIFALPPGGYASNLSGNVQSCIFLRFSGPNEFPFVYSFDPHSLALSSVSFSDTAMTADHFFVLLAKNMIECGILNGDELEEAIDYLGEIGVNPATNVVSRWKALQAAAQRSRVTATKVLTAMAAEDLPNLSAFARRQLAQ